jgi:hypothetical protein
MSTRFKNDTDTDLVLFGPTGHPDAYICEAGAIVEIPGDITEETDDAFVVGDGDDARTWAKSVWSVTKSDALREVQRRATADRKKADSTDGGTTDTEE